MGGEPGGGWRQEAGRGGTGLVGQHLEVGQPRAVIGRRVPGVVADATSRDGRPRGPWARPAATVGDAPDLFTVGPAPARQELEPCDDNRSKLWAIRSKVLANLVNSEGGMAWSTNVIMRSSSNKKYCAWTPVWPF